MHSALCRWRSCQASATSGTPARQMPARYRREDAKRSQRQQHPGRGDPPRPARHQPACQRFVPVCSPDARAIAILIAIYRILRLVGPATCDWIASAVSVDDQIDRGPTLRSCPDGWRSCSIRTCPACQGVEDGLRTGQGLHGCDRLQLRRALAGLRTHPSNVPYLEGGGDGPARARRVPGRPRRLRHLAVRRGAAVRGGRELLRAAARRARPPSRAGDAVADPGAVRPARASRGDRALPDVPDRAAAADPSARRRRAARRWRAARPRTNWSGRLPSTRASPSGWPRCTVAPAGWLGALGRHASWTSSATHAILPLLATDTGIAVQLQTGIESHRRRFGGWDGGLWLPECAYAPWLDPALERAGVRAVCVELTDALGLGSERHLQPMRSADGPVLWPIDRAMIALAWGQGGYPSRPPYRDYHAYTTHRHRVRRIDGGPYDHVAATAAGTRRRGRVRVGGARTGPGRRRVRVRGRHRTARSLVVRGRAVARRGARRGRPAGVGADHLDAARERSRAVPAPAGPASHELGGGGRPAHVERPEGGGVRVARAGGGAGAGGEPGGRRATDRALRELLALQSSDWAFLADCELAGDYPEQRAQLHAEALARGAARSGRVRAELRGLAPWLAGWS